MDKYTSIRDLAFLVFAPVRGIDTKRFKLAKDEHVGYCPVHQSESNNNCFRYAKDGKWHCFSCDAKGRGAIDLTMKVKGIGSKAACELLEPLGENRVGGKPGQPGRPEFPPELPVLFEMSWPVTGYGG